MTKKIGLATILMCGLVLSACGKNTTTNSSQTTTNGSASSATEIEFWYGLGSVAGETMEGLIKEFNASQDEVVVKGVQQADYSETLQKVQAGIAAKNPPAVFITSASTINTYGGEQGVLEPLDKYMAAPDFNSADLLPVFTEPNIVNGKSYGIPAYGTTQIMYYNSKIFKEAGIAPDEAFSSWEKLAEASKTIQEKTSANFGHMVMWGADNLGDIALSNGGSYLSEDGKTALLNTPAWIESWEFIRKQLHDDKTMGINSGGQGWAYWYKTIDEVMAGTAGSYTGSSGDRGDLDFSYIDAQMQPGLNGNPAKPTAGALNMVIPNSIAQAEKDAAFSWITYFTSPEVQAQWSEKIGYVPVRKSTNDVAAYQTFLEENPYAKLPFQQSEIASPSFIDPTGGKIIDALKIAADQLELENKPAKEVLDQANQVAQEALDKL